MLVPVETSCRYTSPFPIQLFSNLECMKITWEAYWTCRVLGLPEVSPLREPPCVAGTHSDSAGEPAVWALRNTEQSCQFQANFENSMQTSSSFPPPGYSLSICCKPVHRISALWEPMVLGVAGCAQGFLSFLGGINIPPCVLKLLPDLGPDLITSGRCYMDT